MSVFLNSSLVVWRESFEAMLVVYLVWIKLKNHAQFEMIKKSIFGSVTLGILVSIGLGTVAMSSHDIFDSQTWIYMQAFLPIVAASLMMHMIVWMSQHAVEIKTKIDDASKSKFSAAVAVFFLLLITFSREGFETVVFLSGMAMAFEARSKAMTVLCGGLVLGVFLSFLTVGLMVLGKKFVNLTLFFFVTNLVLLYIAADMLVVGVSQLIDISIVPVFDVNYAKWFFIAIGLFFLRKQIGFFISKIKNRGSVQKVAIVFILLSSFDSKAEFNLLGYGVIDYRKFQTFKSTNNYEPYYREQFDLSEFALEGEYLFDQGNSLEFEIEIEHGGVGTSYEFEPLEEFGEFESETEKGGEVILSELNYFKRFNKTAGIRIGKFPLRVGLGSVISNPNNNLSPVPSRLEMNMIPVGWNEVGVQIEYKWQDLKTRLSLVNGLNSEFFRTYNWIGGGYQRHFEEINAAGKAILVNLEYGNVEYAQGFAISYYQGDSSSNRYKLDKLSQSAEVKLYSALGNYRFGDFIVMGQYVRGFLENADAVVDANTNLGGLAKPKAFAALGSEAVLRMAQLSYDIVEPLAIYAKYEYVNTFLVVADTITALPRYEVEYKALGIRWIIDENSQLKFESGVEKTKLDGLPETKFYALSFVLGFSGTQQ